MNLSVQEIASCFHLPINKAARELHTCTTNLKKVCRANGITRWPYRKMRSIENNLEKIQNSRDTTPGVLDELTTELYQQKAALLNPSKRSPSNDIGAIGKRVLARSRSRTSFDLSSSDESFEEKNSQVRYTTKKRKFDSASHSSSSSPSDQDVDLPIPPPAEPPHVTPQKPIITPFAASCFSFAPSAQYATATEEEVPFCWTKQSLEVVLPKPQTLIASEEPLNLLFEDIDFSLFPVLQDVN